MDIISKFFSDITPYRTQLNKFYSLKGQTIRLHFRSFYDFWKQLQGGDPISDDALSIRRKIREGMKNLPGYVDNNRLVRISGKPTRCLIIDASNLSPEMASFFKIKYLPDGSRLCSCDTAIVFNRGCQCGGK